MKTLNLSFFIMALVVMFGCSKSDNGETSMYVEDYANSPDATGYYEEGSMDQKMYTDGEVAYNEFDELEDYEDYDDQPDDITTTEPITEEELEKIGKKIIKNADVSIVLEDYKRDMKKIKDTLQHFDCYISSETESNYDNYISNSITIRVKSEQFDSLMSAILSGNGKVTSKNIYVNDVTEQYIDVYQRLKNKKSIEKQYLELLKKAYTVNDVLNVTQYLRVIQEEIEASEGRLKYMDDQSAYSTIVLSVSYSGETIAYRETFWDRIKEGMEVGWDGVVTFVVGIFYVWPLWILLGIVIFVIRRSVKKYNSKKNKNA